MNCERNGKIKFKASLIQNILDPFPQHPLLLLKLNPLGKIPRKQSLKCSKSDLLIFKPQPHIILDKLLSELEGWGYGEW
jgi:hypothetical protein